MYCHCGSSFFLLSSRVVLLFIVIARSGSDVAISKDGIATPCGFAMTLRHSVLAMARLLCSTVLNFEHSNLFSASILEFRA